MAKQFWKHDQDTQVRALCIKVRRNDMNLIAHTIVARGLCLAASEAGHTEAPKLKPPNNLKNHLQNKGRPHTL
jgi:hypothetical protein